MLDVRTAGGDRVHDRRREVDVARRGAMGRTGYEPERVMQDEHLSDVVGSDTDADRRDGECSAMRRARPKGNASRATAKAPACSSSTASPKMRAAATSPRPSTGCHV